MLNTLPSKPAVRQPRALVYINGKLIPFTRARINEKSFYEADTFEVDLPLNALPPDYELQYFSRTGAMLVEIYKGYPQNPASYTRSELTKFFTGQVDDVEPDLDQTNLNLIGRDLTAKFIDNKTTNKFQNLTASQIVTQIAKKRGLTPIVTPTKTKVSYFYGQDFAKMTSEHSEWDLLTYLAQESNYVIYVKDTSLIFKPAPSDTDKNDPYVFQYNYPTGTSNVASLNAPKLKLGRALTIARDVIVRIRSYNINRPTGFTVQVKTTPNKKTVLSSLAQPIGDAQVYTRIIGGLSREQAIQKAFQIAREITQHERRIEISNLQGDELITKETVLKLQGTRSDWDQIYYPAEIEHTIEYTSYSLRIAAKNHSPNTQVLI